jgi:hypothetical protein
MPVRYFEMVVDEEAVVDEVETWRCMGNLFADELERSRSDAESLYTVGSRAEQGFEAAVQQNENRGRTQRK